MKSNSTFFLLLCLIAIFGGVASMKSCSSVGQPPALSNSK